MIMSAKFTCRHCGRCCGPIPVTYSEWQLIRRAIRHMPLSEVERLEKQNRKPLTCPLRDVDNERCSIYEARPLLCRLQGTQRGLPCPHQPEAAIGTDGYELLKKEHGESPNIYGVLGLDLGWAQLKEGLYDGRCGVPT